MKFNMICIKFGQKIFKKLKKTIFWTFEFFKVLKTFKKPRFLKPFPALVMQQRIIYDCGRHLSNVVLRHLLT